MLVVTTILLIAPVGCMQATPSLKITAPTGNAFAIGDVTVSVAVSNFKIFDKQGQAAVKGEGHLHYFMDVIAPTTQDQPAVTEAGTYAHVTATSYTWHNVGGGSHTFSVELVNNDHTPLNPPVVATQTILVIPEIGAPQAVILTPRDSAALGAGDITITTQVSNFNLVDKLGQPNASHEGHLIYFMDAPTVQGQTAVGVATDQNSYTWTSVKAGTHTFAIELVNNDHTPLDPRVVANITITVQ
jgi:hypothetical protein